MLIRCRLIFVSLTFSNLTIRQMTVYTALPNQRLLVKDINSKLRFIISDSKSLKIFLDTATKQLSVFCMFKLLSVWLSKFAVATLLGDYKNRARKDTDSCF